MIVLLIIKYMYTPTRLDPIISYSISIYFSFIISIFYIYKKIKYHNSINSINTNINLKNILNISIPMMFTSSIMFLMSWTDTILLGIYRLENEVGIYSVAVKISMLTSITLFSINSISAPKFSELYSSNQITNFNNLIYVSSRLIFWSTMPILIIILLFHVDLLEYFGKEFQLAKWPLCILLIGQFINALSGSVGFILQMTGKQNTFKNIALISLLLNILLNIVLIPKYGLIGAATSSVICMILWNGLSIYKVYKFYGILSIYRPKYLL